MVEEAEGSGAERGQRMAVRDEAGLDVRGYQFTGLVEEGVGEGHFGSMVGVYLQGSE